jgi:hypothetical protein
LALKGMVIKKTSRHNSLFLDIKKGGKQKKLPKKLIIQIRNLLQLDPDPKLDQKFLFRICITAEKYCELLIRTYEG